MRATEAVRRGGANALANWEVSALYIVASAAVAAIMGPAVSAACARFGVKPGTIDISTMEAEQWWALARTGALLLPLVAVLFVIGAFIAAGSTRTYIDGVRASNATADSDSLAAYRAFDARRWLEAARSGFWRVAFLNAMTFGVLLLVVGALVAGFALAEQHAFAGCLMVLFAIVVFVGGFFIFLCVPKATVIIIDRSASARAALAEAWDEVSDAMGNHIFAVVLVGFCCIPFGVVTSLITAIAPDSLGEIVNEVASSVGTLWAATAMIALTRLRESD